MDAAAPPPTLGADDSVESVARGLVETEGASARPVKAAAPQPPAETPPEEPEAEPVESDEPKPDETVDGEEPAEGEEAPADEAADALPAYTVPGEEKPVPVDELVSGYLRQKDYTQKTMAVSAERTQFQSEKKQFWTEVEAVKARIGQLVGEAVQALEGQDLAALNELRVTDPGAWSAQMLARQQQIARVQQLQAEQQSLVQMELAERVPQERAALAASIPEFAKDFAGVYKATGEYVLAQGFTPAEWNQVTDHRQVRMAYKAMRYDQLATRKAPEVKKQLSTLPKVARPGSPKAPGQVKAEQVRAQRDAAYKSGRVEDIAKLIERALPA